MSFLRDNLLFVRAIPGVSQTKIAGTFVDEKGQEYLKIRVAAAPEDGKANDELINFLSKNLKIPKSQIEITRGEVARIKVIKLGKPDSDQKAFLDLARLLPQSLPK